MTNLLGTKKIVKETKEVKKTKAKAVYVSLDELSPEARGLRIAELLADRGETFEECYKKHKRIAHVVANRNRGTAEVRCLDMEDIHQEALIGLYESFNRYDPSVGIKFITFAMKNMQGRIYKYFRENDGSIRKPRKVQALETAKWKHDVSTVEELKELFRQGALDKTITSEADVEVWHAYTLTHLETFSMDIQVAYGESGSTTIGEGLSLTDNDMITTELNAAIDMIDIPEVSRQMLNLSLMGYTQKQIGAKFGVTQMQAGRILKSTRLKLYDALRDYITAEYGNDFEESEDVKDGQTNARKRA